MKNKKEFIKGFVLIFIGFLLGIHTTTNPTPIFEKIIPPITLRVSSLHYAGVIWIIIYYIGFKKILESFDLKIIKERQKIGLLIGVLFVSTLCQHK